MDYLNILLYYTMMRTITANRVHCSSFNTDRFREHMKHVRNVRKTMVPERPERPESTKRPESKRIESKSGPFSSRIKKSSRIKGLLSLVAKVIDVEIVKDFFITSVNILGFKPVEKPDDPIDDLQVEMDLRKNMCKEK
jgi:hypothetical protein